MADKKTPPAIQDRKIEVTVQQDPILTETELDTRMGDLANIIRNNGCGGLAQVLALHIASRSLNLVHTFPQLAVQNANGSVAMNSKLDCDGDGKLSGNEPTAIILAGGKWMADHPGKTRADVPLDDELIKNYQMGMSLLSGPQSTTCSVGNKPIFPTNPNLSNPSKAR